jgi:hypothetical protein
VPQKRKIEEALCSFRTDADGFKVGLACRNKNLLGLGRIADLWIGERSKIRILMLASSK